MYNIRKIITAITALLFIVSFVLSFAGFSKTKTTEDVPIETAAAATESPAADTVPDIITLGEDYENHISEIFNDGREHFVAHRGYSGTAPENTAVAFELAGKSGFWGIETDIQQTYDDEFVCMHDDTIDRTTEGEGTISEYTYASLREINITDGTNIELYPDEKIPSMVEYLNVCVTYECVPVIEIKHITDYDKFLQTIYNSNVQDRCIVTGGIEDLKEIRSRDKQIALMVIGYSNQPYTFYTELISELPGNVGILYNYPVVTQEVVTELKSNNVFCGVWSLETEEEAEQFMSYGVDYVVTNNIPGTDLMINTNE